MAMDTAPALLRRHLAYQLANGGESRAAQREIAVALQLLTGEERARSHVHRIDIHRLAHVTDPVVHRHVMADAAAALRELRSNRDVLWEARLLHNRAALHFDRMELERAEADLTRSRSLFALVGARTGVAEVTAALLRRSPLLRGDIVACLEMLAEEGRRAAMPPGRVNITVRGCRYLALMQARVLPEALRAAEDFVTVHAVREVQVLHRRRTLMSL